MSFGPRRNIVVPCISIGGMLLLSFVAGAAALHFNTPISFYLRDAFVGGEAWVAQRNELANAPIDKRALPATGIDLPDKTFDGFTLYTVGDKATLVNMNGAAVHQWEAPFRKAWPRPTHVRAPVEDEKIYLFACHLFPNGDLLAVYHGTGDTPYGYGLAKLDKNSNVIWTYSANVHHGVDVGEDGTIYVLTHELAQTMPEGLEYLQAPALVDQLVLLSPDGKERKKVPILEVLRDSAYAALIPSYRSDMERGWDVFHANAVEVLKPEMAVHFPMFQAGQVLISVRELDAVIMVDPETRSVVWAARGPWRMQHDPHFLTNGRLLIFDNRGSARASRVLEYDPQTQACPWSYPDDNGASFRTNMQGRSQRLPNGNTLVVNSFDGVLMEVTPARELVWTCLCHNHVPWAQRFSPGQLTFLPGDHRPRP